MTTGDQSNNLQIISSDAAIPFHDNQVEDEEAHAARWMKTALTFAQNALDHGEVPVGCIFIYDDRIIAHCGNSVNETKNATRHAEMDCIDTVLKWCRDNDKDYKQVFKDTEAVVTVEPCIMCASALLELNIRQIIYGCANSRFGGCTSVFNTCEVYNDSSCKVRGGVFAEEAINLLKEFYKGTNPNAPKSKAKKKKRESVNVT